MAGEPFQVFVPELAGTGWFGDDCAPGAALPAGQTRHASWFDRELSIRGQVITLNILMPGFFDDPDFFFPFVDGSGNPVRGTPIPDPPVSRLPPAFVPPVGPPAGIYVQLTHPIMFDDPDTFFVPIAIRALKQSDAMLKNEVRRIR